MSDKNNPNWNTSNAGYTEEPKPPEKCITGGTPCSLFFLPYNTCAVVEVIKVISNGTEGEGGREKKKNSYNAEGEKSG